MKLVRRGVAVAWLGLVWACGTSSPSAPPSTSPEIDAAPLDDASPAIDASAAIDASDASVDKGARCASAFGNALPRGFVRVDGTVLAVVEPRHTTCALPNDDHVVLQVRMQGAVYRMVVNVQSDRPGQDPRVFFLTKNVSLPGPPWQEGVHSGLTLDYAKDLGVQAKDFTPYAMNELSAKVSDAIPLDGKVSVFSDGSGGASTHLVHRNDGTKDGAIVIDADGPRPTALLFRFANQDF